MSRLLPVDIERQPFKPVWRGYDRDEVRQFLKLVAEEQEAHVLRLSRLEDELKATKTRLGDFEERERIMKEALYSAQRSAEQTKLNAIKEGDLIIREAEQKADRLIDESRITAVKIERDTMDLKLLRDDYMRELESLIDRFRNLAELYKQSRDDEGRVRVLGRAAGEPE